MARIGERAVVRGIRETRSGVYVDAGELGEVLLPRKELPTGYRVGEEVEVFLHTDSEDRLVATTRMPRVMPGSWGLLPCVSVSNVGAFVGWGLAKDLLVPFREQSARMIVGRSYPVWVKVDEKSERLIGTTRIARQLGTRAHRYRAGDPVKLVIFARTKLGYQAVVDDAHSGVLFADAVFEDLRIGESRDGFILAVRPDGKLDLTLQAPGRARVDDLERRILAELNARGGFWAIGDHTPAEEIRDELGVSKRTFKQAVGALWKRREITIEERGIRLSR